MPKFQPGDKVKYVERLWRQGPLWQAVEIVKRQVDGFVFYEAGGFDSVNSLELVKPPSPLQVAVNDYVRSEIGDV